jgi:hypothetical protein
MVIARTLRALALLALALLLLTGTASASTLLLSDVVSQQPAGCGTLGNDPCIDAAMLDAVVSFDIVGGGSQLQITLQNTTSSPTFDVNELHFSAASNVSGLSLVSATHSVAGDVTGGWTLHTSTGQGGPTHGDGFGIHDFSLTDGVGNAAERVGPGENVVFLLDIGGTGPFTMDDFVQLSAQTPGGGQTLGFATVKFVNGAPGFGGNDSAFGANTTGTIVPEPALGALLGAGLLAGLRRGRR